MFHPAGQQPAEEAQKKQPTITSMWLCVGSGVWCWEKKLDYELVLCYVVYNEALYI